MESILSDFSRVLLKPKDENYKESLNTLHRQLSEELGHEYPAADHFVFNDELLDFYASLKGQYPLHLFTTDIIQNHPHIRPKLDAVFDNIISASEHGLSKKDPAAYRFISDMIKKEPMEIVFIDDQLSNLEAAKSAGMKTVHYQDDNERAIHDIKALLAE